jgi:hypothetical protein
VLQQQQLPRPFWDEKQTEKKERKKEKTKGLRWKTKNLFGNNAKLSFLKSIFNKGLGSISRSIASSNYYVPSPHASKGKGREGRKKKKNNKRFTMSVLMQTLIIHFTQILILLLHH